LTGNVAEMVGFQEPVFGRSLRFEGTAFADVPRLNARGSQFRADH